MSEWFFQVVISKSLESSCTRAAPGVDASVLLVSSLRVAAQAQTATPTPESGNEMEF